MRKYTPSQRKQIYLMAADKIKNKQDRFCCIAIKSTVNVDVECWMSSVELFREFPEIRRLRPDDGMFYGAWWHANDRKARIVALQFCAEMCK
jgi:hypothetical protein